MNSTSRSMTGAVIRASLPAQDEAVDAVLIAARHELVACAAAPGGEVGNRPWVGRKNLEQLSRGHGLDRLCRLDDRHRALQAASVELRRLRRAGCLGQRHL